MKKYLALVSILGIAACSSGGTTASQPSQPAPGGQASGAPRQGALPGANGLLAAMQGNTLQVQSSTSQTAVTWSATTTFTDTVPASAAAVTVGSCVNVRDSAGRPTATPDPSATRPTSITAVSVSLSAPVNGACTGGLGGGPGGRGTPPSGFARPSGGPGGGGGFGRGGGGGGAFGKVVSKSASGFVVQGNAPGQATSTVTTTVTTTGSTTYTTQQKATSSALKVGECVSARGQADSAGTVAAGSIAISPATNGLCTTGFGAGRG